MLIKVPLVSVGAWILVCVGALGYCQCSFVAVVPLVSLDYVNLAPCALKLVEVAVCACTCISRSL